VSLPAAVYRPRNPQLSDYCRCVEDYFETFVGIYDEHFTRQNDFWRSYLEKVICRYLDCGDLQNGFAYVKCKDCGHEYLLAFFCKCRCFQLTIFNAFLSPFLNSCESEVACYRALISSFIMKVRINRMDLFSFSFHGCCWSTLGQHFAENNPVFPFIAHA